MNEKNDDNNQQRLATYYKTLYEREDSLSLVSNSDYPYTKRKSNRLNTNGIVALTSLDQPIVTRICDISPGGISFLHANEIVITDNRFQMDILIFDILTDFEYLINQIYGQVKSKKSVFETKSNAPSWRFSVEFVDLDSSKQNLLKILFSLVRTKDIQLPGGSYQKLSYDS